MLNISDFPWAEIVISENRSLFVADNLGGTRTKRDRNLHRFELELTTVDMDFRQGRSVVAKLSGSVTDDLYFVHPRYKDSAGTIPASSISILQDYDAGIQEIEMFCSELWELKSGDIFVFSNSTKVYTVMDDTGLSSGVNTVKLTCPLQQDMVAGTIIKANDVGWTLQSDGKIEYEMIASDNQDIPFTLITVEKI